jgi:SAM-dependent methyltransferase
MTAYRYYPEIFQTGTIEDAKRVILAASTADEVNTRWEVETPYLADLIVDQLKLTKDSLVLDYGCGIGRMSKALIEKVGCPVVGVDISPTMLLFAPSYVGRGLFTCMTPDVMYHMVGNGLRFDAAIAIWALQHCFKPQDDIDLLHQALDASWGKLFVLSGTTRYVPLLNSDKAFLWGKDDASIKDLLCKQFKLEAEGVPSPDKVTVPKSDANWWGLFS